MTYTTLITAAQLQALQQSAPASVMVFDCTFDLADSAAGRAQFAQTHIADAVYAHLDEDLSAQHGASAGLGEAASGGRHPLPSRERFAAWLSLQGFRHDMQAVVYDRNGLNYAGRLWWMLKWAGHEATAVLDGGLQAWQAAAGAVQSGSSRSHPSSHFALQPPLRILKTAEQVLQSLGEQQTIIDARAPARYRGEVEPLDRVAGHIPGALNRPFSANMDSLGHFKPAAQLRAEFDALLADRKPHSVVHQCGSGVSALPNLIAMELAGYPPTALFAGSWSEWCGDATRPVARGL